MKKQTINLFILIQFLIILPISSQVNKNTCSLANFIFNEINSIHFKQIEINDAWSEKILLHYISELDPQGLYFTLNDYNKLLVYKDSIDDFLKNSNCRFYTEIVTLYNKRVHSADSIVNQILNNPINFKPNDSLIIYKDNRTSFPKNCKELTYRWESWIKYRALLHIFSNIDSVATNISIVKYIAENDREIRRIIKDKLKRSFKKILNPPDGYENYMATRFYNTIASEFDPHTSYFSESDKNDFVSDLMPENYTYGFDYEENPNGELIISRLVPGGPAWKSNVLNKGDIIISIQYPGKEKIDLSFSDENEMDEILNNSNYNKIELTVRKPNSLLKTATLIKEKLSIDENLIKSLILKGAKNVGYISLPGFYTDWDQYKAGCANDMAKEIIKLKKENIQGLIIDLRFNGGGSMQEAIALAGIFIDEGPLLIEQERNFKPWTIKDLNRGTIYDGPLLLLINSYSASASEILAATLQDYNRAIIVGNPTYGKASSQIILPLSLSKSTTLIKNNDRKHFGFIKVTTRKLYRITGKSYQNTGVIPDINIPGYLDFGYREDDNENALIKDSLDKKILYNQLPKLPVSVLSEKSKSRVNANINFKTIKNYNDSLYEFFNKSFKISLNPKSFKNSELKYYHMVQNIDSLINQKCTLYLTANPSLNQDYIETDQYYKELNSFLQNKVQNDIYIEECYKILLDFINFKEKNLN